ncbi:von Willebrand factor A domain-containing protein 5A-like, partial [Alosa pseudoharengus]|uniref:von Willebrand factor A domain-containing protein 5A-like n=1 Tax=Alosa pseudoharengus TaxID=34774 RepID=UPI003F8AFC4F
IYVNAANPDGSVTIQYNLLEETVKNQLSFCLRPTGQTGVTLHRLGARALIRSLEMEERAAGPEAKALREKLLQLSLQSGVSCTHTAFIAIHKGSGQTVQGPLLHRTVPTPGMFFGAPMPPGAPMPVCYSMPMACVPGSMPMAYVPCSMPMEYARCSMPMQPMARMTTDDFFAIEGAMFDEFQEPKSPTDPLLLLISLQKASGS